MSEGRIAPERIHYVERQLVEVDAFESSGYTLDIGGGGEGIIGLLKGERVIAIDTSKRELEECPSGPLKIVMDARELLFLDGSFSVVTAFFALMYIKPEDRPKVFVEAWRVLAPGGAHGAVRRPPARSF